MQQAVAGYPPGSIFRMRTGTTPTSGWTAGIRIATQATPGKQIRKVGNVLSPVTASRCELLVNYGEVDQFEWDLCFPESAWPDVVETVKMARNLQPDVLMRDRGIGMYGDIMTPEMWIPTVNPNDARAEGLGQVVDKPWQVIFNMAGHAAYDPQAEHCKSAEWVLTSLIDVVAKGGNFMPMLGADAMGNFHPVAVERLKRVGRWLAVNGEAIYKTRPYQSWHDGDPIRYTRSKDSTAVYAIALKWPDGHRSCGKCGPGTVRRFGCSATTTRCSAPGSVRPFHRASRKAPRRGHRPCELANAFRIEQERRTTPPPVTVKPPKVVVERWAATPLVTLSTDTAGAEIRYTLDSQEPDGQGLLYEGPFHVNRETIVKVAAYKQNMLPSDIVSTTVSDSVSVNFQPEGIPVPEGWLADSGKTFSDRGNDLTKYHVTIGLGDSRGESRNTVHVEGVSFCNELLLDSQGNEVSKIVAVNDGRLTIGGGSIPPDTKIRFVKVAIADPGGSGRKTDGR